MLKYAKLNNGIFETVSYVARSGSKGEDNFDSEDWTQSFLIGRQALLTELYPSLYLRFLPFKL